MRLIQHTIVCVLLLSVVFVPKHVVSVKPQSNNDSSSAVFTPHSMTNTSFFKLLSQIKGEARNLAIADTRVYVGSSSSMRIIDIADPYTPRLLSSFPISTTALSVVEPFAYITSGSRLVILDVRDPQAPQLRSVFQLPINDLPIQSSRLGTAVQVAGDLAYVLNMQCCQGLLIPLSELDIVDVHDPNTPQLLSRYSLGSVWAIGLRVVAGYTYIVGSQDIGGTLRFYADLLEIVDTHDSARPIHHGSYRDCLNIWCFSTMPGGLAVKGETIYSGLAGDTYTDTAQLTRIDATNSITPTATSRYPISAYDIQLTDKYIFVASGATGVQALTDAITPTLLASFAITGSYDLELHDQQVYVADVYAGLFGLHLIPQATATITQAGGAFSSPIDAVEYTFSADTFTDTVVLTHTLRVDEPIAPERLYAVTPPIDITATVSGSLQLAQPTQPYSLTFRYSADAAYPVAADTLAWYWWDGAQWQKATSSRLDTAAHMVTARPQQFGRWAVLGETHSTYLSAVQLPSK